MKEWSNYNPKIIYIWFWNVFPVILLWYKYTHPQLEMLSLDLLLNIDTAARNILMTFKGLTLLALLIPSLFATLCGGSPVCLSAW